MINLIHKICSEIKAVGHLFKTQYVKIPIYLRLIIDSARIFLIPFEGQTFSVKSIMVYLIDSLTHMGGIMSQMLKTNADIRAKILGTF